MTKLVHASDIHAVANHRGGNATRTEMNESGVENHSTWMLLEHILWGVNKRVEKLRLGKIRKQLRKCELSN